MKRVEVVLGAALVIWQAGCAVGGKTKASPASPPPPQPVAAAAPPAPPPEPLSVPQTQVKLPAPQPIDADALPPEPPAAPAGTAAPPARPSRPRPATPKPPAENTAPPANANPTPPAPEPRPPIQEIVPESDQKRWQEAAQVRKREVRQWLDSIARRRLSRHQQSTVERIRAFLKDSDDAEARGAMREADALAERAQILVQELQNGQ